MRGFQFFLLIAVGLMLTAPVANAQSDAARGPVVQAATPPMMEPSPAAEEPNPSYRSGGPVPVGYVSPAAAQQGGVPGRLAHRGARRAGPMGPGGMHPGMMQGGPQPAYAPGAGRGVARASYDQPHLPGYAWPSYAAHPNYAALTYPRQYSPTAWPFIGPFYPYPQVPLGWRKVTLEWDDGWWMLDFKD